MPPAPAGTLVPARITVLVGTPVPTAGNKRLILNLILCVDTVAGNHCVSSNEANI